MQISNNDAMLSIGLKLEHDDSFSLDDASFSCSPTGASFSSASSIHGPFTPNSGRSTPALRSSSADFDHSFMSTDGLPYNLTPPSSQGSVDSYFELELAKTCPAMDMDMDIMTPNRMPATPTRLDNILDNSLGLQDCFNAQMTPLQPLENMYSVAQSLVSPPFMFPTPPEQQHVFPNSGLNVLPSEKPDMWSNLSDDGDFELFSSNNVIPSNSKPFNTTCDLLSPAPAFNFNNNPAAAPSVSRRLFVADAQKKTNTLQQHLHQQLHGHAFPQLRSQALPRSSKRTFDGVGKQRRRAHMPKNVDIDHVPSAAFRCHHKGCETKAYVRMEHLKRHISTEHDNKVEVFVCEFCNKPFKARKDNYLSHVVLHTKAETPNGRTKFYPGAEAVVARLREQIRERKNKGRLATKRRAAAAVSASAAVKATRMALTGGL